MQVPFYLKAEVVAWDYVDGSFVARTPLELAQTMRDATHLGSTFDKARFVHYTDATFSKRVARRPQDEHLGLLGPLMRVLEGDRLIVHLRNEAPFNVSLVVPALYEVDAPVPVRPGATKTFEWWARDRNPRTSTLDDSPTSRLMLYYSDADTRHIDAGLLGPLLLVRPEALAINRLPNSTNNAAARLAALTHPPRGVEAEFVLVLHELAEDASPLALRNYAKYGVTGAAGTAPTLWQNQKYAVNGRMFGSLPGLRVRLGDRVRLHVAAFGEAPGTAFALDIAAHALAQPLALFGGQVAYPRDFVAKLAGNHSVVSLLNQHAALGMRAVLSVAALDPPPAPPRSALSVIQKVPQRAVYLQAEPLTLSDGGALSALCVFRQYTDDAFETPVGAHDPRFGVVGPLLRFTANELVAVTLANKCSGDVVLQLPALVRSATASDDDGVPLQRGGTARYVYSVPASLVCESSRRFVYRGAGHFSTLVGVYTIDAAAPTAPAAEINVPLALIDVGGRQTINGYVGADVPALVFEALSNVRFDLFSVSSSAGELLIEDAWIEPGAEPFLPCTHARSVVVTMPFAGTRRVVNTFDARVSTLYTTTPGETRFREAVARAPVRRLYVRAEMQRWDYAPLKRDPTFAPASCQGSACWRNGTLRAMQQAPATVVDRPVWVQYSDATFAVKVGRVPHYQLSTEFLGFLGPMLRVLHTERIELHLRNALPSGSAPVQLAMSNCLERISGIESNPRAVDANDTLSVAPGATLVLQYIVAASLRAHIERANSSSSTFSSHACLYRNAGAPDSRSMHGALVVTRSGTETSADDLAPRDFEHELVLLFGVNDGLPNVNGFMAGNLLQFYGVHRLDLTRCYVGSLSAGAWQWVGLSAADEHGDLAETFGFAAGSMRTLEQSANHNGTMLVRAGSAALFDAGGFAAFTITNVDPFEELLSQAEEARQRPIDGAGIMHLHRRWGAAGAVAQRLLLGTNLSIPLPPAKQVDDELFRAIPPAGTRRRPLTSQLLEAFTSFVLADIVELSVQHNHDDDDDHGAHDTEFCAVADKGALPAHCEYTIEPTGVLALPMFKRSAAAVAETRKYAVGGLPIDPRVIEYELFPAVTNQATAWIDASPVYGSNEADARAVRTFVGGELTTDMRRWPKQRATIQLRAIIDLLVREHNRRARVAAAANPRLTDEQLYGEARRLVIATVQFVTEREWLPALIGQSLPPYAARGEDGNETVTATAGNFEVFAFAQYDGYEPDVRGDVSLRFALACAPALLIASTPTHLELLNSALRAPFAGDGGDASASLESKVLLTEFCSGGVERAERCLAFGAEAVLRGLFTSASTALDSGIADELRVLRLAEANHDPAGRATAALEWLVRGREAMVPPYADYVRLRGGVVPTSLRQLIGLPADANLTQLVEAAFAAAKAGGAFDKRPLIVQQLERLYPLGVEQLDALVGLLVEPPTAPLSTSIGPTLSQCLTSQVQRLRAADRLWYENNVANVSELLPDGQASLLRSTSLMRRLLLLNYDFTSSKLSRGTLSVPTGFEAARGAVERFVSGRQFTGSEARAVRLAFHQGVTYDAATMADGFANGNCILKQMGATDPLNSGLERAGAELSQLRASVDGALFRAMSDADLVSLIGAVGVAQAVGGVSMRWRPGRRDVPANASEASVCPMRGKVPLPVAGGDTAFPHTRTLEALRANFRRQGFNARETVALLGGHSLGGVQLATSGFPTGSWTLERQHINNQYFRNLLAFSAPAHRVVVQGSSGDKFSYRLVAGMHQGEVGVLMLPSDVAMLGDATMRGWIEAYAADNDLFLRDFAHTFQRLLENGAPGVGAPLAPLSDMLDPKTLMLDDEERLLLHLGGNAAGAPPALPFFSKRTDASDAFGLFGPDPAPRNGRAWQSTLLPLPSLRFSFATDEKDVFVLFETPSESYVGFGLGPRIAGAAMRGGDFVQVALRADGSVAMVDEFAVTDQLQPRADVNLNGTSDWRDVTAERTDGVTRYWMTRARNTGDARDNVIPAMGAIDVMFALGAVALRDGTDADVLATYHSAARAVASMEWRVPVVPAPPSTMAVAPTTDDGSSDGGVLESNLNSLIGGLIGAAVAFLLCVVLAAYCFVRRQRQRTEAERARLKLELQGEAMVDGARVPVPPTLKEVDLNDGGFPLALLNPAAGLFRDPVLLRDYDAAKLQARRTAQQQHQVPLRGQRLLVVDKIYCDVLLVQNVSDTVQEVIVYLPSPAQPQFKLTVEPARAKLAPAAVQAFKVSVCFNCTTKQKFSLFLAASNCVAELPQVRIESELSTALDFDEIQLVERIGEGSYGVVYAGRWRKQPVAVKLLRRQQFGATELSELRAEAKFLSQLLHRNIVQFRGCVFRESQCCLVTELAPHGSLKTVLYYFSLPWDLVIKLAVDVACGLQFLHVSGIIHRDIKSDNVLVFSLSPREVVCAKLTDFGSARAVRSNVDTNGKTLLGADRNQSAAEGTPIYMAPQLFAKTSRPSEASDCYALGCLFYEIAAEREPWSEMLLAWDVGKAVMAGKRPAWPPNVLKSAPAPFVPLVNRMWAQQAEARPSIDEVLQTLADAQSAIGDTDAAETTRRNLRLDANQLEGGVDKAAALASATNKPSPAQTGSDGEGRRSVLAHRTASTAGDSNSDKPTPLANSSHMPKTSAESTDYASSLGLKSKDEAAPESALVKSDSRRASLLDAKPMSGIVPKNRSLGGGPPGVLRMPMLNKTMTGTDYSEPVAARFAGALKQVTISDLATVVEDRPVSEWSGDELLGTESDADDDYIFIVEKSPKKKKQKDKAPKKAKK